MLSLKACWRIAPSVPTALSRFHRSIWIRLSEPCRQPPIGSTSSAEAPVFLVFCADYYRAHLACTQHGQSLEGILEDLDTVIVGAHEVGIAVGTAVAAAESLGLGSVVIGDIRQNPLEVIKELGLPPYVFPVLGLCIGYAAEEPGLKPRLPQQAVYFEETYNTRLEGALEQYDTTYAQYLKIRPFNNRVGTWTELVSDFYKMPYHYEQTVEMLRQQKFLSVPPLSHHAE